MFRPLFRARSSERPAESPKRAAARRWARSTVLRADPLEPRHVPVAFTVDTAQPVTSTNFHTIQEAIDKVPLGELFNTIDVAPGTYQEAVVFTANNVTLRGPNAGKSPLVQGEGPAAI